MFHIDATEIMGETELGVLYLVCRPVLKLFHDLNALAYPRGSQGMAAGQETPVRVHGNPAVNFCFPGGYEGSSLSLFTEAQFLDLDDLGNTETVVYLGNINVLGTQL